MKIQIKDAKNSKKILEITEETLLYDVMEFIALNFNIPFENQHLLHGFPPKPISLDGNAHAPISTLGIIDGDALTVRHTDNVSSGVRRGSYNGEKPVFSIPKMSGRMIKREMPQDNSCLFHALVYTCQGKKRGKQYTKSLRDVVVSEVRRNPNIYTAQLLGQPPYSYCQWISNPDVWGGAIELKILSKVFKCEIVSFDFKYLREDHFGLMENYKKRVFLVYTGKHYDCIAFSPSGNGGESSDQEIFSTTDDYAWKKARGYVEFLHEDAVKADSSLKRQKTWRTESTQGYSMVDTKRVETEVETEFWACKQCTMHNALSTDKCGACGADMDGTKVEAPGFMDRVGNFFTGSGGMRGGKWNCPTCTYSNAGANAQCEMCGASNA